MKAIWGWLPLLTMIPTEVVIIHPGAKIFTSFPWWLNSIPTTLNRYTVSINISTLSQHYPTIIPIKKIKTHIIPHPAVRRISQPPEWLELAPPVFRSLRAFKALPGHSTRLCWAHGMKPRSHRPQCVVACVASLDNLWIIMGTPPTRW